MLRNELKIRLRNKETVYGTMVQEMTSATVAQIFKRSGFDFIIFMTLFHLTLNLPLINYIHISTKDM